MDGIQISMFDASDPEQAELRSVLRRGGPFSNGALRIYAAWNTLNADRFAEFLADEFGVGGHSISEGFCDYDGKGLVIRRWRTNEQRKYSWKRIAKEYEQLIRMGEFPDTEVRRKYEEARAAGKGAPAPRMYYY